MNIEKAQQVLDKKIADGLTRPQWPVDDWVDVDENTVLNLWRDSMTKSKQAHATVYAKENGKTCPDKWEQLKVRIPRK